MVILTSSFNSTSKHSWCLNLRPRDGLTVCLSFFCGERELYWNGVGVQSKFIDLAISGGKYAAKLPFYPVIYQSELARDSQVCITAHSMKKGVVVQCNAKASPCSVAAKLRIHSVDPIEELPVCNKDHCTGVIAQGSTRARRAITHIRSINMGWLAYQRWGHINNGQWSLHWRPS